MRVEVRSGMSWKEIGAEVEDADGDGTGETQALRDEAMEEFQSR